MTRVILYPFPRLDPSGVTWTPWTAAIAGHEHALDEIADSWDSDSDLTFRVSVRVTTDALAAISVDPNDVQLVATVSCRDTAYTATFEGPLDFDTTHCEAHATVRVVSRDVSENLELRAVVLAPHSEGGVLRRRILTNGPGTRVALDSSLTGFPTVAYSFNAQGLPPAPWRLAIEADDAEAPFAHSVRLELNEDNERIRALMSGTPDALTSSSLVASIARVLIGSVARMLDNSVDARAPAAIAADAPDSITAAAARAARQYLGMSLDNAIRDYRMRPERFDYALSAAVGLLEKG